jgi:hypothetical protein
MHEKLTEAAPARNTQAQNQPGIIAGGIRRGDLADAIAICRNGGGYIRRDGDLVLIYSDAFTTVLYQ